MFGESSGQEAPVGGATGGQAPLADRRVFYGLDDALGLFSAAHKGDHHALRAAFEKFLDQLRMILPNAGHARQAAEFCGAIELFGRLRSETGVFTVEDQKIQPQKAQQLHERGRMDGRESADEHFSLLESLLQRVLPRHGTPFIRS